MEKTAASKGQLKKARKVLMDPTASEGLKRRAKNFIKRHELGRQAGKEISTEYNKRVLAVSKGFPMERAFFGRADKIRPAGKKIRLAKTLKMMPGKNIKYVKGSDPMADFQVRFRAYGDEFKRPFDPLLKGPTEKQRGKGESIASMQKRLRKRIAKAKKG